MLDAFDNLWFLLNFVEGLIFLVTAVYFTVKPEKTTFLISNFDRLPKAERERYDLPGLARHLCRAMTLCGAVCLLGAFAALKFEAPAYWITTVLWIGVAIATLRADNEKVLRKYRKD